MDGACMFDAEMGRNIGKGILAFGVSGQIFKQIKLGGCQSITAERPIERSIQLVVNFFKIMLECVHGNESPLYVACYVLYQNQEVCQTKFLFGWNLDFDIINGDY